MLPSCPRVRKKAAKAPHWTPLWSTQSSLPVHKWRWSVLCFTTFCILVPFFFFFPLLHLKHLKSALLNWLKSAFSARNNPQDSTWAHLASLGQIHNLKPHPSTSPAESISPFSLNNNNLIALQPFEQACWAARFYMMKIQKYKVKGSALNSKMSSEGKTLFLLNFSVKLCKWKCQVIEDREMVGEPERKEKKRKSFTGGIERPKQTKKTIGETPIKAARIKMTGIMMDHRSPAN